MHCSDIVPSELAKLSATRGLCAMENTNIVLCSKKTSLFLLEAIWITWCMAAQREKGQIYAAQSCTDLISRRWVSAERFYTEPNWTVRICLAQLYPVLRVAIHALRQICVWLLSGV